MIFAYAVSDPERYGAVEFDPENFNALSIEEKPAVPKSNFAVQDCIFITMMWCRLQKNIKPSPRGEYEITDVKARTCTEKQDLKSFCVRQGFCTSDTGTFDSLHDAAEYVRVIEKGRG